MQRRRRPRAVTLTLPDEKQPYLILDGTRYTLRNFSEEGIGLWMPTPAPFGLNKGNVISGDVLIGNEIHPVTLEVVRQAPKIIGFRIAQKSPELSQLFKEMLEPANYAYDVEAHSESGALDEETGWRRLWFQGRAGTELVVWFNEHTRSIHALQLCWLAKWVLRQQFCETETGWLCDETRPRSGKVVREEELLTRHKHPDADLVSQAAQFLGAVPPPLPGAKLWQFLETGEQVYLPEDCLAALKVA